MNQADFEDLYPPCSASRRPSTKPSMSCKSVVDQLLSFFPVLKWLPAYKWKENLHGDLVAGITVGIMVVPQAMAYASLAGVPPVNGLYACFFAAFFYIFFGTSRHISIGTFAVVSMMTHAVKVKMLTAHEISGNSSATGDVAGATGPLDVLELTSSLTFGVGVFLVLMGVFRLSFLTRYMSDPLVSGFTTGCAVHVFMSQVPKALGVKTPPRSGNGMILYMLYDDIMALPKANLYTVGIAAFGIVFLSIGRDYVNPWFKKRYRIPLPLELFLVVVAILVSQFLNLEANYAVKIVKHVPQGIPSPSLPNFALLRQIWPDALAIAVICYMFVFSMGQLFAKKHKYQIDANQELYALGFGSLLGSFFPIYPAGASLSRSSVCEMAGAKTQLNALFTTTLLFIVIAALGPLLEPLPMAILACIVMVSLKSLFLQITELPRLWTISKFDFAVWIVSCLSTVCTDVQNGLIISVVFILVTVVLREQWPKFARLGMSNDGQIFKSYDQYEGLLLPNNGSTVVMKFEAPLHFANVANFREEVLKQLTALSSSPENVSTLKNGKAKAADGDSSFDALLSPPHSPSPDPSSAENKSMTNSVNGALKVSFVAKPTLVVDCSAMAYVDTMGVEALKECHKEGVASEVKVFYAGISDSILTTLEACKFFDTTPKRSFFPTVREAVLASADV